MGSTGDLIRAFSTPPVHLFRANASETTDEASEIANGHDRHVAGVCHFVADSAAN